MLASVVSGFVERHRTDKPQAWMLDCGGRVAPYNTSIRLGIAES